MDPRDVAKLRLAKSFLEIRTAAHACGLKNTLEQPARMIYGGKVPSRSERAFLYVADEDEEVSLANLLLYGDRLLKPILTESHLRVLRRDITTHLLRRIERDETKSTAGANGLSLPKDLRAWAEKNFVLDLLTGTLGHVQLVRPRGDWYAVLRARHDQPVETFLRDKTVGVHHQRDVLGWLQNHSGERKEADQEEREHNYDARELPGDPAAAAMIERLRAVRRSIRQTIRPRRSKDYAVVDTELTDTNPPYFRYDEAPSHRRSWGPDNTVTIPLDADGQPRPVCRSCDRDCVHAISALDHLLGILFGEVGTLSRQKILDAASTPTWQRWISELDSELSRLDNEPGIERDARVWWGIDTLQSRVGAFVERRGKRGTYLKPKRTPAARVRESVALETADTTTLLFVELHESARRSYRTAEANDRFAEILTRLADHPRVFVGDGPPAWTVAVTPVGLTAEEVDDGVGVRVAIGDRTLSSDEWLDYRAKHEVGTGTLVEFIMDERLVRVTTVDRRVGQFLERWRSHDAVIPREAQGELMRRLSRVAQHVPVVGSDVITRVEHEPASDLVLVLTPLPRDVGLMIEIRVRPLVHGPLFAPGAGPDDVTASTPDRQIVFTTRDRHAEIEHAQVVADALFSDIEREGWTVHVDRLESALMLAERLRGDTRVECVWPQREWRRPKTVTASALQLRVQKGNKDWFDVEGRAEIDDHRVDLAVLLDAARTNERYLRLQDGHFLELERSLFERVRALEPHTTRTKNGIELAWGAMAAVDEIGAEAESYEAPDAWTELIDNIRTARALKPKPPRGLGKVLRDYQKEGHAWLSRLAAWNAGAVLADDMGLGKTIQAIAVLMDRARGGPQLVVAPTSVGFNWVRELAAFAPKLNPIVYAGPDRAALLEGLKTNDVVIVSYAIVQRDGDVLAETHFHTVVLDEAQAIKNPATKRSRAVRGLDRAWTFALTGTPVENHPGELWALFAAVFPGLLGSWERFKRRFLETEGDDERETAFATAALSKVVRPFVLRRTKAEVAKELPPRTEITVDVVLSKQERALYDDARLAAVARIEKEGRAGGDGQFRFKVLAALTRLRQLACHPRLVDDDTTVPSAKLNRLMEIVQELIAEGRRALVFSQFTKHLALVREALEEAEIPYAYLDGSTPAAVRGARVDEFQDGDVPLFLISVKAGGTGLNLTAADTVVHLDPWWNPAVEDQATDRAHRIGQTNPVTVYRLVTRDTVEERILELHADKRQMVEELLSGAGHSAKLDTHALADLIQSA